MRSLPTTVAVLLLAVFYLNVTASAAIQYIVTDLGTLGDGTMSEALGINNSNQVVGYSFVGTSGETRAFLYSNGTMTDLGVSGPGFAYAKGINNNGVVVGLDGNGHLFTYSGGTLTPTDMLVGGYGNQFGFSDFGINNSGQIVGAHANSGNQAAFLSAGTITDIPFGTGLGLRSGASAINDSGSIVGTAQSTGVGANTHAFLYSDGTMIDLGTLGGSYSEAEAINNRGQITGTTTAPDASLHGFVYMPVSAGVVTWTDLGNRLPNGINNSGQVVGGFGSFNGHYHAFLYSGGTVADLNTLIDPASGWELFNAYAINDNGVIVGAGVNSSFPLGQEHAFMAVPVPEPGSATIFILGVVLATRRVRWDS